MYQEISAMKKNPMLEAALEYAKRGWRVMPLWWPHQDGSCSCRRGKDCPSPGKHPIIDSWVECASTDEMTIRGWWSDYPNANVGIATGESSGLIVLDVDLKGNGPESLKELQRKYGLLPRTRQTLTGSGGMHILFKFPEGSNIGNKARFHSGLDIRGNGGMIVAPPSIHASGKPYRFTALHDLADCPEWLTDLIKNDIKPQRPAEEGNIPEGSRNTTLTRLAGSMRRYGMEEETILTTLLSVNNECCSPPLKDNEVASIAKSVSRYCPEEELGEDRPKSYANTELGNAERFVRDHQEVVRFCYYWGKWLVWDGTRWVIDNTGEVHRLVDETVRGMLREAAYIEDYEERKKLIKWQQQSEKGSVRKEILETAKHLEGIPILPEDLDKPKYILNLQNGELDLRTGSLAPHNPQHHLSKLAPAIYDPEAKCPTWLSFLQKVTGGSQELMTYLQQAIGYSLTSDTSEQCMFILYGNGANGKSTFLNTVMSLLGDYAKSTPTHTLMAKKYDSNTSDLAALKGARFVVASEAEENQKLAESLVKRMTGGDPVTARFLYQEFFAYTPKFKIFLATNHKPQITGTDNAIWRRIRLIPFKVCIPEEQQDKKLQQKLAEELPGILNWALEGCMTWQQNGLGYPPEIKEATESFRHEMDIIAEFIEDCCIVAEGVKVPNMALYESYKNWSLRTGRDPMSQTAFSSKLQQKDYRNPKQGKNGHRVWQGISLKPVHGLICPDGLTGTDRDIENPPMVLDKGERVFVKPSEVVSLSEAVSKKSILRPIVIKAG